MGLRILAHPIIIIIVMVIIMAIMSIMVILVVMIPMFLIYVHRACTSGVCQISIFYPPPFSQEK